jgi:hypothetical protein
VIKTKHTCRFAVSAIDAPRVAGNFPNPPRFAQRVQETSSHPWCVQSRTHLPASMFVIVSSISVWFWILVCGVVHSVEDICLWWCVHAQAECLKLETRIQDYKNIPISKKLDWVPKPHAPTSSPCSDHALEPTWRRSYILSWLANQMSRVRFPPRSSKLFILPSVDTLRACRVFYLFLYNYLSFSL